LGVKPMKNDSRLFGVGSHDAAAWRSALFIRNLLNGGRIVAKAAVNQKEPEMARPSIQFSMPKPVEKS
jgi:hypothetical protein